MRWDENEKGKTWGYDRVSTAMGRNIARKGKTWAYLRVSTEDQDLEKSRTAILRLANQRDLGQVTFVEEKVSGMKSWKNRRLAEVVGRLETGDRLIVPELSRLGRSLVEVLEVLNILMDKGVDVYGLKEGFQLSSGDVQSKMMRMLLALFSEIERDLIRQRTREALAHARRKGVRLGRPPGSTSASKLDGQEDTIRDRLSHGYPVAGIARELGVSRTTMNSFIRTRRLKPHDESNHKP
jgi:DNA invertase Pin-like site-specific DNA recombinase